MMYFFRFSPPATVFATSPALAAMSTKFTFAGVDEELRDTGLSPDCRAKVERASNNPANDSVTIEKHRRFVGGIPLYIILQVSLVTDPDKGCITRCTS